jgi:hypothetical protein
MLGSHGHNKISNIYYTPLMGKKIPETINEKYLNLLKDIPTTPMSETSRTLLREDPLEWVMSRRRNLRAALLELDKEAIDAITDDIAHGVGIKNAEWLTETEWETLVRNSLDENIDIQ